MKRFLSKFTDIWNLHQVYNMVQLASGVKRFTLLVAPLELRVAASDVAPQILAMHGVVFFD